MAASLVRLYVPHDERPLMLGLTRTVWLIGMRSSGNWISGFPARTVALLPS